ncbi:MAG: hypothetical protein QW728_03460 [Thermoplasmata archaeon]
MEQGRFRIYHDVHGVYELPMKLIIIAIIMAITIAAVVGGLHIY